MNFDGSKSFCFVMAVINDAAPPPCIFWLLSPPSFPLGSIVSFCLYLKVPSSICLRSSSACKIWDPDKGISSELHTHMMTSQVRCRKQSDKNSLRSPRKAEP